MSFGVDDDRSSSRSWLLLALGAVLVAAIAVALTLALTGGDDDPVGTEDPEVVLPTGTADPTDEPDDDPTDGPTEQDPVDAGITDEQLAQVEFQRVVGVRVPVHPTAGPTVQQDGLASGFERSELGAVMAAFALNPRSSVYVGPAVFRPTVLDQFVEDEPGDVQDTLARIEQAYERRRIEEGAEDGSPLEEPLTQLLGWAVDFYDGTNAEVRLLVRGVGANGQVLDAAFRAPVRWVDDDWRAVAPPDGDFNPWVTTTFDEADFTLLDEVG